MNCPFYERCNRPKNSGFCESTENLLLCREYNKLKKIHEIEYRAEQILKEGVKIRL